MKEEGVCENKVLRAIVKCNKNFNYLLINVLIQQRNRQLQSVHVKQPMKRKIDAAGGRGGVDIIIIIIIIVIIIIIKQWQC